MIEVKTIVTENLMRKFNAFQARQRMWVPIIAAVVLIVLGFLLLAMPEFGVVGCVVLVVLGLCMPLLYWVAVTAMVKKTIKNSPLLKSQMTQIFRFSDSIHINESSKYVNSNDMEYAWELLYKVYETHEAFYLYINKFQAFIIDRNGFTAGLPQDLHDLLQEKLEPKKFKYNKRLYGRK